MARTKQEVRDFLNALVGQMVNEKCGEYNGQCVSLIKALLEFLGAPNPYAGRGNAKDVGDTLVRQGIARNAAGWLNVCVNRSMGNIYEPSLGYSVNYGHIWLDLSGEMNIEQNGNRALHTTKNTRPIAQAQQIVNLDQYIIAEGSDDMPIPSQENYFLRYNKAMLHIRGREMSREEFNKNFVGRSDLTMLEAMLDNSEADQALHFQNVGRVAVTDKWDQQIYNLQAQVAAKQAEVDSLKKQLEANGDNQALIATLAQKQKQLDDVTAELTVRTKANEELQAQLAAANGDTELLNGFGLWMSKIIARLGLKK